MTEGMPTPRLPEDAPPPRPPWKGPPDPDEEIPGEKPLRPIIEDPKIGDEREDDEEDKRDRPERPPAPVSE